MRRILLILTVCVMLGLAGCAGNNLEDVSGSPSATSELPAESVVPPADTEQPATADTGAEDSADTAAEPLVLGDFSLTFGFTDESGSRLIVRYYEDDGGAALIERPEQYTLAIGDYGQTARLSFAGWQDATDENNYEDTAGNFDNLPGYVYSVQDGELLPDSVYGLIAEGTLDDALIPLIPSLNDPYGYEPYPELDEDVVSRLPGEREIRWTEKFASTENGAQIGLVFYEPIGEEMLFSIVYTESESMLSWHCANEGSPWWEGLGEQPGLFTPLFLARLNNGLVLALTWGGPDGENIVFLYEDNGQFINRIDYDYFYRYWSPV